MCGAVGASVCVCVCVCVASFYSGQPAQTTLVCDAWPEPRRSGSFRRSLQVAGPLTPVVVKAPDTLDGCHVRPSANASPTTLRMFGHTKPSLHTQATYSVHRVLYDAQMHHLPAYNASTGPPRGFNHPPAQPARQHRQTDRQFPFYRLKSGADVQLCTAHDCTEGLLPPYTHTRYTRAEDSPLPTYTDAPRGLTHNTSSNTCVMPS